MNMLEYKLYFNNEKYKVDTKYKIPEEDLLKHIPFKEIEMQLNRYQMNGALGRMFQDKNIQIANDLYDKEEVITHEMQHYMNPDNSEYETRVLTAQKLKNPAYHWRY